MLHRLAALASLALVTLTGCAPRPDGDAAAARRPLRRDGRVTVAVAHRPAVLGAALPDAARARLAITLRRRDEAGLQRLLRDQADPTSPRYHAWLTPAQFGERFGLPPAEYDRVVAWIEAAGLQATRYPNRLFVEADGTVAAVRALCGVQLRDARWKGRSFRSHAEDLSLPAVIAPHVVKIGGLDTRLRHRHRMNIDFYGQPTQVLSADDIRTLYNIPSSGAAGLTLAVLGTQEGTQPHPSSTPQAPLVKPSTADIQTYLDDISGATATYKAYVLPNPADDFDSVGANSEYQLDVEMQSIGAPHAAELALVLSPSSMVFQTGVQYIVNNLSNAVAVSISLGLCEDEEVTWGGGGPDVATSEVSVMRQAVQQGLAEGQTWFASSGDTGADDCFDDVSGTGNGFGGGNATVDFPCSLPEIVCVGGTQFKGAGTWDAAGNLTGYAAEEVCNEGADGVAGGGGQSKLYAKPSWQTGIGPLAGDGQRNVPDISLTAATSAPGVATYDCGTGQDACGDTGTGVAGLDVVGGTSVSSPLAAGMFANLAGELGCSLGDIHPILYALGAAQQAGGNPVYHDVTTGDIDWVDPQGNTITGFTAAQGYDLASGWGSIDLTVLLASWPGCGAPPGQADGGKYDAAPSDGGAGAEDGATADEGVGDGAGADGPAPKSGGGCNCTAAGGRPAAASLAWLGGLALFLLRRRRRVRCGGAGAGAG